MDDPPSGSDESAFSWKVLCVKGTRIVSSSPPLQGEGMGEMDSPSGSEESGFSWKLHCVKGARIVSSSPPLQGEGTGETNISSGELSIEEFEVGV